MTRDELLQKLRECIVMSGGPDGSGDPEAAHSVADDALLEYINDAEISAAFDDIYRWYA